MIDRWLTRDEAAKRIDRSERTLYRWEQHDLIKPLLGRYRERDLLEVDRRMRGRRGRPRGKVATHRIVDE